MATRTNVRNVRGPGIVALGLAILLGAACGGRATPAALASDPSPTGAPTSAPAATTPPPPITQPKAGTWRRLPAAPIAAPYIRTSVWTGTEMLILGRAFGGGSPPGVLGREKGTPPSRQRPRPPSRPPPKELGRFLW